MPGTDGFSLARTILGAAGLAATRIVMLTSAGVPARPQRRRADLAIAAQLSKPVKQADLREVLVSVVAGPGTRAGGHEAPEGRPRRSRRLDILVVEDNATNQTLVAHVLGQRGDRVTAVSTGQAAVEAATTRAFDVILMDVQMPGMDGFEATAAIRAHERQAGTFTPIVALTAHTMAGDRERCLAAGMNAFVSKPLRPATLLAAIDALVAPDSAARSAEETPSGSADRAGDAQELDVGALLDAFGRDRGLLDETAGVFLADLPEQRAAVDAAVAAHDPVAIARAAHAVRGAVGLFSTGAAYQAACRLEDAARRGALTETEAHRDALAQALGPLTDALLALGRDLDAS
jgi:two-component system sensor histidine kinase/response regulator